MRYNFNSLKKYDFIELETFFQKKSGKYVVISVLKDLVKVVPILEEDEKSAAYPIIAIPYSIISNVSKLDANKLLFYSDLNNLYIKEAILRKNNRKRADAKV